MAEIKILNGDYLHITQPEALKLLLTELSDTEIRLFESRDISFHPKAYLFRWEKEMQSRTIAFCLSIK